MWSTHETIAYAGNTPYYKGTANGRVPYVNTTVTPRAACAPITKACSMSAVLDGPLIKQP